MQKPDNNQRPTIMSKYPHYLERLQAATRKFWDKPALNNIGGETFTLSLIHI